MLVVDDDETFRQRLGRAMRARGFAVTEAADFDDALTRLDALASATTLHKAVVDLRMPGGSGLELVRRLRERSPGTAIVVLTGYATVPTAVEAVRAGAVNYLAKPAHADAILAAFSPEAQPVERAPEPVETPSLASVEWEHIHRVLADADGNVSQAARRLGMHRRTLQRKLAKYPPPR
ncbi:MAG: response regulator [Deltaproteobacteria bacterium]|nr:response regulator [Deltaproteobacteria bacterium]